MVSPVVLSLISQERARSSVCTSEVPIDVSRGISFSSLVGAIQLTAQFCTRGTYEPASTDAATSIPVGTLELPVACSARALRKVVREVLPDSLISLVACYLFYALEQNGVTRWAPCGAFLMFSPTIHPVAFSFRLPPSVSLTVVNAGMAMGPISIGSQNNPPATIWRCVDLSADSSSSLGVTRTQFFFRLDDEEETLFVHLSLMRIGLRNDNLWTPWSDFTNPATRWLAENGGWLRLRCLHDLALARSLYFCPKALPILKKRESADAKALIAGVHNLRQNLWSFVSMNYSCTHPLEWISLKMDYLALLKTTVATKSP